MRNQMSPYAKQPQTEKIIGRAYSPTCSKLDCNAETDVVINSRGNLITRCTGCYDQDLRRARKNQLRIDERNFQKAESGPHRSKLAALLKEMINAKNCSPPETSKTEIERRQHAERLVERHTEQQHIAQITQTLGPVAELYGQPEYDERSPPMHTEPA